MAADAKKKAKTDALSYVEKATPEQLVQIASGTALGATPLVKTFSNDKVDELRTMIRREFKYHADFRGMVIRQVNKLRPPKPADKGKDKGDGEKAEKGEKPEKGAKEQKKEKPAKEDKGKKE